MRPPRHHSDRAAPIGVFDSGIGGLSVLQALRAALPGEDIVYIADSAHTPYGERSDAFIIERSQVIAEQLRDTHGAKLLMIACNTASAAAAERLRQDNPGWPIVAIEPALKPAARATRSGHVGVLATRSTLGSDKFAALRHSIVDTHAGLHVSTLAADGLAAAIEHWAQSGDERACGALLDRYLAQLLAASDAPAPIDRLVLGCTHYPLLRPQIARRLPPGVALVDAGLPVARQVQRLLHATGLLRFAATHAVAPPAGRLELLATGSDDILRAAAERCLSAPPALAMRALAA